MMLFPAAAATTKQVLPRIQGSPTTTIWCKSFLSSTSVLLGGGHRHEAGLLSGTVRHDVSIAIPLTTKRSFVTATQPCSIGIVPVASACVTALVAASDVTNLEIIIEAGQCVQAGEVIATFEANKANIDMCAPMDGYVSEWFSGEDVTHQLDGTAGTTALGTWVSTSCDFPVPPPGGDSLPACDVEQFEGTTCPSELELEPAGGDEDLAQTLNGPN